MAHETTILKKLDDCNIINRFVDFYEDPEINRSYLVLEYAGSMNLGELIEKRKKEIEGMESYDGPIFPEDIVHSIMRQLFQAVEFMHRNNICHRDLKPDNIIVSSNSLEENKNLED